MARRDHRQDSPDLSPNDFWLFGVLKNRVKENVLRNEGELEAFVCDLRNNITMDGGNSCSASGSANTTENMFLKKPRSVCTSQPPGQDGWGRAFPALLHLVKESAPRKRESKSLSPFDIHCHCDDRSIAISRLVVRQRDLLHCHYLSNLSHSVREKADCMITRRFMPLPRRSAARRCASLHWAQEILPPSFDEQGPLVLDHERCVRIDLCDNRDGDPPQSVIVNCPCFVDARPTWPSTGATGGLSQ
jgi:hypothetical protein